MVICPRISPIKSALETCVDTALVYSTGYSLPKTTLVIVLEYEPTGSARGKYIKLF